MTIDDVARAAGVSRQSVSNVIHDTGRVGAATRARIHGAIDDLGYVLHPGASSLRSRRTGQIAFPLGDFALDSNNTIAVEFVMALVRAAGDLGHHVLLTSTGLPGIRELISSGRVDGFVFADLRSDDPRVDLVAEREVPFACFGRTGVAQPQLWADIDNAAGTRAATQLMIERGYREVVYLGFTPDAYWDADRTDGYREAMALAGLPSRVVSTPNAPQEVLDAARSVVAELSPPAAIVCGSDVLASGVYSAAAERRLEVGRDVAVSGFDASMIGNGLVPHLTSVRVPVDTIADLVMDFLVKQLAGEPAGPPRVVLPTVREGQSTPPVATPDAGVGE